MNLRNFVIVSLLLHSMFLSMLWFVNLESQVEMPEKPIITRIVPPEEIEPLHKVIPKKVKPPEKIIIPVPKKGLSRKKIEPPKVMDAVPEQKHRKDGEQKGSKESQEKEFSREDFKLAEKKAIENILEKEGAIAEKEKKEEGTEDEDIITFSTKKYKYYGYLQRLEDKLETSGIWKAPPEYNRGEIFGDLLVRVTFLKDGELGEVKLLRTSGYKSLDDYALKALNDGEPWWPLPDEWKQNSFTLDINFVYPPFGSYYVR